MTRKYHNHTLQTNPRCREEEPQNTKSHKASTIQLNENNQPSLPHHDHYNTRMAQHTE